MLTRPMDVLEQFPVRKSKTRKREFRQEAARLLESYGYTCHEERGSMGAVNLVAGDPERAKYLITAHYDTCARMLVPNFITPCNAAIYLLYQLVLVLGIVGGSALLGIGAGILTGSPGVGELVYLVCLFGILYLMMAGPANPTNANDNTSGVVTLLEIARTLPENRREQVCFVLFDLEELGLVGSASYKKAHPKAIRNQLALNLDCVGDGETIMLFPTGKLKKSPEKLAHLRTCCGSYGTRRILLREKGFSVYPSDQYQFPYGVGICALRGKRILYLSRIHTAKDTTLNPTNVNILRAALITLITCPQGE